MAEHSTHGPCGPGSPANIFTRWGVVMSVDRVSCSLCGEQLQVPDTTRYVTCGQCRTSLVVRRSGSSIYTEPVAAASTAPPASRTTSPDLRDLQRQQEVNRLENELNRLDIDWEKEKEEYKVSGRYGHRYLPKKGTSAAGGVLVTMFGIFWTIFAFGVTTRFTWQYAERDHGPPLIFDMLFPLFGVVFVISGIMWSVNAYRKAEAYEQAEQRYLDRKDRLREQLADLRRN